MEAGKLPQSSLRASRTPGQSWVNGLFPLLPLDRWSRPEQEGSGSVGNLQWLEYVVRMVNRHLASQGLAVKTKNSVWTHSMRHCWISVFRAGENRELLWISIPVACHCEQYCWSVNVYETTEKPRKWLQLNSLPAVFTSFATCMTNGYPFSWILPEVWHLPPREERHCDFGQWYLLERSFPVFRRLILIPEHVWESVGLRWVQEFPSLISFQKMLMWQLLAQCLEIHEFSRGQSKVSLCFPLVHLILKSYGDGTENHKQNNTHTHTHTQSTLVPSFILWDTQDKFLPVLCATFIICGCGFHIFLVPLYQIFYKTNEPGNHGLKGFLL